jgi:hypothetical protein
MYSGFEVGANHDFDILCKDMCVCVCVCVCIYIYVYIYATFKRGVNKMQCIDMVQNELVWR